VDTWGQCGHGAWFSTESIGYHIGLSRMIIYSKIIILDQFQPSSMSKIQVRLSENILETLMVHVYFTALPNEIMPPDL
jgi:hypothetical protein